MHIDKLAFLYLKDGQLMATRTRGNTAWYLPGGKREGEGEGAETDAQALTREIMEELGVALNVASLEHYGVFEAQAHGKPAGTLVRITCYTGSFIGQPQPCAEIEEIGWLTYADKVKTTPASYLLFDDLHAKGLLK